MYSESLDDGPVFSTSLSVLNTLVLDKSKLAKLALKQDFLIYSEAAGLFCSDIMYSVYFLKSENKCYFFLAWLYARLIPI